jgi:4-amino-4-deoxy-L-arabinose transferase-like glycosyltransferase
LSSRINAPSFSGLNLYKFAENIVAGKGLWLEGFGFAARPPIYPCFLALAAWAGGSYLWVVLPQALFGATTVAFAYLIGKWLFGERAALLSEALTAIYPYYVVHDTALEKTSLVTMLTAISVYACASEREPNRLGRRWGRARRRRALPIDDAAVCTCGAHLDRAVR